MSSSSLLHATITKRQTYILDGAELSYYIQSLASSSSFEEQQLLLPNLAPRSPRKCNRVGSVTFVTATLDNDVTREEEEEDDSVWLAKGTQIIGVQVASNSSDSSSSTALEKNSNVITIDDDLQLYKDSIAILNDPSSTSTTKLTKQQAVVSDTDQLLLRPYC